ncbi:MAG TPA: hypothetical protein VIL18_08925 [Longimicrobiales bacterium]
MSRRRLLSTRRVIPLDRLDEYLALWREVQRAATQAGARAWLFRALERQDHFVEFIEFGDAPGALESADLVRSRAVLDDTFGAGQGDEWEGVE